MIPLLKTAVLLIAAASSIESMGGPAKRRVIVANTIFADEDSSLGDPDSHMGEIIADLEKQFPGREIVLVNARTNAEMKTRLAAQVHDPAVRLDGLFVMSHGSTLHAKPSKDFAPGTKFDPNVLHTPILENRGGGFGLKLNDPKAVKEVFGPVVGRFSEGAKIIFAGCSTIEVADREAAREVMSRVARNFGLKSGRLYMNKTLGGTAFRSMTRQSVLASPDLKVRARNLLSKIMSPITAPTFYALDHLVFNKGYSLVLEPGKSALHDDDFFNASMRRRATGEQGSAEPEAVYRPSGRSAPKRVSEPGGPASAQDSPGATPLRGRSAR